GRFIALNEVGGDPSRFALDVRAFHDMAKERAALWPASLSATATHDTKRGEDTRARLLALSHAPETWRELVHTAQVKNDAGDDEALDRYMALQTLIGAWPADEESGRPLAPDEDFRSRIHAWLQKALREAKSRSTWTRPNEAYEAKLWAWTEALMQPASGLRGCVENNLASVALAGFDISLARTALKLTIPGAPDIYQGCEFADFSLVDPDNRRPVDYAARAASLEGAQGASFSARKQALIAALLQDRAQSPQLYAAGDYQGATAPPGWMAFHRSHGRERLFAAVRVDPFQAAPPPGEWTQARPQWRNLLRTDALPAADRTRAPPVFVFKASG
ncbi:MAG: hypothetical protein JWN93_1382, partial [Hyphomicrobiales bacterium]|nr:hypothetical protein [Hyphomicrobiales bacterium]